MREIAFVGYGELGRQLHAFLGDFSARFVFLDDALYGAGTEEAFPFRSYSDDNFKNFEFVVSLGYHRLQKKKEIIDHIDRMKRKMISFVHPSSFVNSSAEIGAGTFIYPLSNIDKEVRIGRGVLLNNSVCISHNNRIQDCCYISPGVVTSGFVEIGECTFIGSGAIIADNVKIGKNVIVGPGTVITSDLPDDCSTIGNPARILTKPLRLSRND